MSNNPASQSQPEIWPFNISSEHPVRSITLAAKFENLDVARNFAIQAAEESGFEPAAVYSIELAIDEAFSNIIEHAYGGESEEKIDCACQFTKTDLIFYLRDCGNPFNPLIIPDPNIEADLEEREVGGLGFFFIKQLMDEVSFTFSTRPENGKHCNVLKMVKHKEK